MVGFGCHLVDDAVSPVAEVHAWPHALAPHPTTHGMAHDEDAYGTM